MLYRPNHKCTVSFLFCISLLNYPSMIISKQFNICRSIAHIQYDSFPAKISLKLFSVECFEIDSVSFFKIREIDSIKLHWLWCSNEMDAKKGCLLKLITSRESCIWSLIWVELADLKLCKPYECAAFTLLILLIGFTTFDTSFKQSQLALFYCKLYQKTSFKKRSMT